MHNSRGQQSWEGPLDLCGLRLAKELSVTVEELWWARASKKVT